MASTIGRVLPAGRKHLTSFGVRTKHAVDDATKVLSPLSLALIFVVPVVAAALFYVWTHVATVRLGYELSAEAKLHEKLIEENRGLRIEIATLKSPQRLKKLARETYGMAAPALGQVLLLKEGESK